MYLPSQIEASICAVPTADAVATGEVICYNLTDPSQGLRRRTARGTGALRNDLACEDAPWPRPKSEYG